MSSTAAEDAMAAVDEALEMRAVLARMGVGAPKLSPQDMADFMCELALITCMADGRPASSYVHLDADQTRKIVSVANFLLLLAPHRQALLDIVRGRR